jgi:hypothetical protein
MKKTFVLLAAISIFSMTALADIPPIRPTPPPTPNGSQAAPPINADSKVLANVTVSQTVAGGLLLSLAILFGGIGVMRLRKKIPKTGKVIALGSILFLCGVFTTIVSADSPPMPSDPKGKTGSMLIKVDDKTKQAVLKLNKNQIKQLRAALDEADDANDSQTAFSPSRTQTIVSGLFLSVAFLFGGVWMFRAKPSKTIVGIFLLIVLSTATTLVFANAGPPSSLRTISSKMFSNELKSWRWGYGEVKIQVVNAQSMTDPNNAVELIVPQAEEDKKTE